MPDTIPTIAPRSEILEKLGFEFIGTVLYEPTGLMHPSYVREKPEPAGLYLPLAEP